MNYSDVILIINLVILESLLSVDNAAVLALMVKDLPIRQQTKALRYGLLGAYLFRGLCLFFVSLLMQFFWLKIIGGAYLLYLVYGHSKANDTIEEMSEQKDRKIFMFFTKLGLSRLGATVCLVEIMDLAFSIDNIFAAAALSNRFYIIMIGVAIGILAMRFIAGWFVLLINRYPSLEKSAFIVIFLLGIKLIISGIADYSTPFMVLKYIMASHVFEYCFSGTLMIIFFVPLLKGGDKTWQKAPIQ